jgi:hypothetical protein
MTPTVTVRAYPETREAIKRLAEKTGLSAADVLAMLVRRAEEDELLGGMNDDFAALRSNPSAWAEYRAELEQWDSTLLDGLEP